MYCKLPDWSPQEKSTSLQEYSKDYEGLIQKHHKGMLYCVEMGIDEMLEMC